MVWTGHGGGSISHGDDFLTEKMPVRLRQWLGIAAPAPAQAVASKAAAAPPPTHGGPASTNPANAAFYAIHVAPLFARSCISCHRPEKHKGGLRMDTYAQLMLGGEDGPVVVPGKPDSSDIIRRLRLPPTDDDSMPSDGDKPLTPEEIQTVERWIAAGAKSG
jgi:mono/diheme cytochrome c family protein